MKLENKYHIFRMESPSKDGHNNIEYVADGPEDGLGRNFSLDGPITASKNYGGLAELSDTIFDAQRKYVSQQIHNFKPTEEPFISFSFVPSYEYAMRDERVWTAEALSPDERIEFLTEMQKRYREFKKL